MGDLGGAFAGHGDADDVVAVVGFIAAMLLDVAARGLEDVPALDELPSFSYPLARSCSGVRGTHKGHK